MILQKKGYAIGRGYEATNSQLVRKACVLV